MKSKKLSTNVKRILTVITTTTLLLTTILTPGVTVLASAQSKDLPDFSPSNGTLRNVMYYGDWSIWGGQGNFYPSGIPADQLTHLNFAFLDFDANGNLIFTDKDAAVGAPVGMAEVQWGAANAGILSALQELRAANPNLRIGVSIGGWSKSGDFTTVAANPGTRARFVENVMKFIKYTNMDFVDIDWEYPALPRQADKVDNQNDEGTPLATAADKENYILLLQDLKNALNIQGEQLDRTYELSVAIPASKSQLEAGVDIPRLFQTVDFANIMTYDLHGAWDSVSGHHTGLYTNPNDPNAGSGLSVDASVSYLLSKGAPSNKIVIGSAFYTRGWEKVSMGSNPATPGLFGEAQVCTQDADQTPSRGAANEAPLKSGEGGRRSGVWNYGSLQKLKAAYPGLKEYWDDAAKAPYLYDTNTGAFFTYDNQRSIREKAAYVLNHNLGGMISWAASGDAVTSNPLKKDELTKTIKDALFGTGALPEYEIGKASIDASVTVTPYSDQASKGFEITIKNNAAKNETGEVLSLVELAGETIKLPKIYIKTKSGANFSSGGYGSGTVTNVNGIGVADLATVYDNQTIGQGSSCTFKLATTGPATLEDIISIELSQRIIKSGSEISRQVLYGDDTTNPDPGDNAKPVISGAGNITIKVGDIFNPLTGVTAMDEEDGNLTSAITVSGTVDTSREGTYTLIYSVTDSKNATTTISRIITVEADNPTNDTYDPNKVYVKGDIVVYNGKTYICNWWTLGENPETSAAWSLQVTPNPDGSSDYIPGHAYLGGDLVSYNGSIYEAQWWTTSVPGSDASWKLISN